MNLQAILQTILSNPILIILIIGGGSSVFRAFRSIKEKQAQKLVKQQIQQQRRQAELDELRTGRRSSPMESRVVPVANENASRQQEQDLKRQRIEEIRQARIEQLKKIRAKRSTGAPQSSSQSSQSSSMPTMSAPVQRRSSKLTPPQRQPQQRQARPQSSPGVTASNQTNQYQSPYAQKQPKKKTIRPIEAERQRVVNRPAPELIQEPIASTRRRRSTPDGPIEIGTVPVARKSRSSGMGSRLRADLRQAIIAKEVLGTPIGLRSQGEDGFGTL